MDGLRVEDQRAHARQRSPLIDKRRSENFPVALRVLPKGLRTDLVTVYDVLRTIDDLGDEATGHRAEQLHRFAGDMAGIWQGRQPEHPVLRRLAVTVAAHELDQQPFTRIVEANLVDQRVQGYHSFADLRSYCALSAEPVGRIVLRLFGASSPRTVGLSDQICAALQVIEHCQDVGEDRRAGRVYLPRSDLARFAVEEVALDAPSTSPALRQVLAFELERAEELLRSGAPLVGILHGWARIAVAGYVAGGRAAIDAIRRIDYDVLARSARPRRRDLVRHLMRSLAGGSARAGER